MLISLLARSTYLFLCLTIRHKTNFLVTVHWKDYLKTSFLFLCDAISPCSIAILYATVSLILLNIWAAKNFFNISSKSVLRSMIFFLNKRLPVCQDYLSISNFKFRLFTEILELLKISKKYSNRKYRETIYIYSWNRVSWTSLSFQEEEYLKHKLNFAKNHTILTIPMVALCLHSTNETCILFLPRES